jgi:hypothetical protein
MRTDTTKLATAGDRKIGQAAMDLLRKNINSTVSITVANASNRSITYGGILKGVVDFEHVTIKKNRLGHHAIENFNFVHADYIIQRIKVRADGSFIDVYENSAFTDPAAGAERWHLGSEERIKLTFGPEIAAMLIGE